MLAAEDGLDDLITISHSSLKFRNWPVHECKVSKSLLYSARYPQRMNLDGMISSKMVILILFCAVPVMAHLRLEP